MNIDLNIQGETLNLTEGLLERYNVPGPRYTSYPTAPEWNAAFGPADYERALDASNQSGRTLSLYMHLPFCERLCLFCGCNVIVNRNHEVAAPYLKILKAEVAQIAGRIDRKRPVEQFHWGGGTPTYFSPAQLEELFACAGEHFSFAPDAELGIEIDPRVTTREHLETLRRLGFNRLSMGIQDFNPKVQETVRRVQPYEKTKELFDICRELGFDSLNVDLIYGLPHQTVESFVESVDKVIGMGPNRIAMFSYAHVPWMKKQQGALAKTIPLGMDKFQIFRAGIGRFTGAGYTYIGMDHFARPDDELCVAQRNRTLHRNFQGYTTKAGSDLLGMGVTSISGVGAVYAQNYRGMEDYCDAVEAGLLPIMRGIRLTDDDVIRRAAISRILCHCVLDKKEFAAEFHIDFDSYFADELSRLQPLCDDGLVELDDASIRVTLLGRIFIRNVGMVFDKYLRKPKEDNAKPVFSKTL
ncbi:MAG: oxygen-independent coproporphyrinogen III oxidase [Acidobacteriota bacterium]|jgi:oxygen-independent coproporphyrinogen-3 oxidase|nr:oxygen-independent coproporphyrinogen III oxidase [Acidobacteriota bacterium]